jgi:DNA-binding beta-propeller fold protein YncE
MTERLTRPLRWFIAAGLTACTNAALAQNLPPIFDGTPRAIAPAQTVAEFPKPTFLENLIVTDDGLVVTSHEDGRLLRIVPGRAPQTLATVPGKINGVAASGAGGFVLTAFDPAGKAVVHLVSKDGRVEKSMAVEGAQFLNGIESMGSGFYLIADSYRGVVWRLDANRMRVDLWLQSPLLERADTSSPLPAANGIRRDGHTVLVSNTARMTLVRVPLNPDGSAGPPAVWKDRLNIDDFALQPDRSIVAATHIYNSVIRIDPQGRTEVIAEAAQGMTGSTSVALSKDGRTAYVTTNGGLFLPPPGGVQPGRVVELKLPR